MHAASARHTDRAGWAMLSPADHEALARLRVVVEAGNPVPPDLARNVLMVLDAFADTEDRILARNAHIRRAAVLIDGSAWARAEALLKEAEVISRVWHRLRTAHPEGMTLRGELHAAKLRYELPSTARSFYNIIPH